VSVVDVVPLTASVRAAIIRGRNGFDRVVQRLRVQADENLISKKLIANNNYYYEQAIAA